MVSEDSMDPGQFDMQQLFAAAAQLQGQLATAQQRLAEAEVSGNAGGGLVTVTLNGQGDLIDVSIAAEAVESGDAEEIAQAVADLVLAACRDAYRKLRDLQAEAMSPLAGGLGGLGGLAGLGGLGSAGLPGLPGEG